MRFRKNIAGFLKTVFVSTMYASSLFIATGLPQVAMATTCNELVPGTTIKYSDALVGFVYDGAKTYAISKSAITGSLNLPDAFFAFTSGIDRGYQYTGVDTASLKFLVTNGKYGAARPVFIDSKAKQDFVTKQFLQYLGAAGSARSTYINAWKEFGVNQQFTDIVGAALPYTNWTGAVTPDTSTITAPQAVTMGSDGTWLNGENAQRISQVVEFDGKLDCAQDLSTAITPPLPPIPPPTDSNAIQGLICAQDLNLDGQVGSNELQNCIKTPQGNFCPVGSLDCTATYQPAICPQGSTLNTARDMCQADPSVQCPNGYTWDTSIDKCTASVACSENGSFNSGADRCEKIVQNDCPIGYTYDGNTTSPTYDHCIKAATCADGGSFVAARDRCEKTWTPICDTANGYSFNVQAGVCQRAPICSSGSYNTSYNFCIKSFNPVCPSGYNFNSITNRCEMVPVCPIGTTFNSATNRCEVSATSITGYSQPITGKTEIIKYKARGNTSTGITQYSTSPPSLDSLSFDFILQNGQVVLKQECAWGGSGNCGCDRPHWNGWCRAGTDLTQTWSGNTLTVVATIFDWNYDYYSPYCDSGYTLAYDSESGSPYCMGCPTQGYDWESGTYYTYYSCSGEVRYPASKSYTTGAAASADLSEFVSCPAGYTLTSPPSASTCTTIVSQWGVQTGITDCTQAGLYSCSAPVNACNAGYTLAGNVCYQNPTCPSGTFDYGSHVCYATVDKQCNDGFSLDAGTGLCIKTPTCPNGGLNPSTDMCEATVAKECGTYSLDATTNVCFSAPICANGAYDASHDVCQASLTRNCGTYSWSQADFKCIQSVVCTQDSAYPLNGTIKFDGTLDICASDVVHNCIDGTTYNGLPVLKCEAVPVCNNGAVRYDTIAHACYVGDNTCPLGSQYSCMNYNNKMQCSANSCFDQSNPAGGEVTTTMDESMYQDDARNPDGSCSGQIMIFAGKPSRCRPPGLKVGYINNCCKSDQVMSEDVGNSIQTGITAIKTMYEIGQVAYYTYAASTGAATVAAGTTAGTVVVTTASGATTLSGAVASGVAAGATAGTGGATAAGMMASMQAYATALLNPATIAVAIVIMVVMKVLMGSGCDQTDIQTGGQVESKQCHYVGDYCEKKWPLFGCVQQAKGYCCFNSMMARIIHEQGRPQLTTFGADGAWGSPSAPNCRGFVPGEFEALDFAKIDMSEYFNVLQKDMATKIQNAQDAINNTIQQRTQQIQSGK